MSETREPRWFHGTRYSFNPGDKLEGGRFPVNQGFGGPPAPHVYYSGRPSVAMEFADCALDRDGDIREVPRVYEVRPDRSHERDPDEELRFRSFRAQSAEVVREVDGRGRPVRRGRSR